VRLPDLPSTRDALEALKKARANNCATLEGAWMGKAARSVGESLCAFCRLIAEYHFANPSFFKGSTRALAQSFGDTPSGSSNVFTIFTPLSSKRNDSC
jgi:hypothetical protein